MPRVALIAWVLVAAQLALCPGGLLAQEPEQALAEAARQRAAGNPVAALATLDEALATYPANPLLHFNRGVALVDEKRYEEAIAALRSGLALDATHAEARLTLAKVLVTSHQYEPALAEIDRYAELAGTVAQSFDELYVRGLALRHLNRLDESEAALRAALAVDPGHADALFNLGAVLVRRGVSEEAVAYLHKAAGLAPSKADVRYQLSQALRRVGDSAGAQRELEEFRRLKAGQQQAAQVSNLMQRAERSISLGRADEARELYQQVIRQDADNIAAHLNLGLAYEQLGQGPLAEAMFRKVLDLQPDHVDAHLNLGLKLAASGRFEAALASITEALRIAPDNLRVRQGLAMVLTRLDRPLDAVPHFEAVARHDPDSSEARLNLGIALAEAGRQEDALRAFREAVRLAPEISRPHYNVARVLNDMGRVEEAREALQQALRVDRDFAPALHLMGQIERAAGRDERAVELLRSAAEEDSENSLVHYDLGLALAQSGSRELAVPHFERALELDPRHKESLYNLAQAVQAVDPEKAREYRERFAALKAEEQDTDRAGTLWNFALAEAQKERWAEAFDLFQQALAACGQCPARGQIHKNFGLTYGHAGELEEAERELLQALKLLPDDPEVQQALRIVRQSRRPQ
ncbi:MAG: tetratricopeptide repeat protein [Bryobacterales bacterium]|nr:tetratricopeptide repeat protein [Bryobacterales bacterium]